MRARCNRCRYDRRGREAFTLIEVVLAIMIAMGILLVVLFFYNQAAQLRTQLLLETDRLATIRLLLDRLTSDLRCARGDYWLGIGLTGDALSLSFLSTRAPSLAAWRGADLSRTTRPEADLSRITYRAALGQEDTNTVVIGLIRDEQPLAEPRQMEDIFEEVVDPLFLEETAPVSTAPLAESIRFIRFRYWDGANWQETWDSTDLPAGVEVSFGGEPLPEDLLPDEYPYELFRRIIYLPTSSANLGDLPLLDLLDGLLPPEELLGPDDGAPADEIPMLEELP